MSEEVTYDDSVHYASEALSLSPERKLYVAILEDAFEEIGIIVRPDQRKVLMKEWQETIDWITEEPLYEGHETDFAKICQKAGISPVLIMSRIITHRCPCHGTLAIEAPCLNIIAKGKYVRKKDKP